MYDKDGQHPLPQWALGPGATVCDLCAYVCRSLLDRSRLSLPPTLYDISEITIFSFLMLIYFKFDKSFHCPSKYYVLVSIYLLVILLYFFW